MGESPAHPCHTALGRVGRTTRALRAVEARQITLAARRVELIAELEDARRQLAQAHADRRAAS